MILFLRDMINMSIGNCTFDDGMKPADITPIFKKDEPIDKVNYRPISCLPPDLKSLKEF